MNSFLLKVEFTFYSNIILILFALILSLVAYLIYKKDKLPLELKVKSSLLLIVLMVMATYTNYNNKLKEKASNYESYFILAFVDKYPQCLPMHSKVDYLSSWDFYMFRECVLDKNDRRADNLKPYTIQQNYKEKLLIKVGKLDVQ